MIATVVLGFHSYWLSCLTVSSLYVFRVISAKIWFPFLQLVLDAIIYHFAADFGFCDPIIY